MHIKALSPHTIRVYRDTFKLFLPYAANYHNIKISALQIVHLSVEVILDFLDSLEKKRQNSAKTRNSRLAALKSLAKMICFMYPDQRQLADRILSIPQKRAQRQLIGFLYPYEIYQILQTVDLKNALGISEIDSDTKISNPQWFIYSWIYLKEKKINSSLSNMFNRM